MSPLIFELPEALILISCLKALPNETQCRQRVPPAALGPVRRSPPRVASWALAERTPRRKLGTRAAAVDAPAAPARWSAREDRAHAPAATPAAAQVAASAPPRLTCTLLSLARVALAPSEWGGSSVNFVLRPGYQPQAEGAAPRLDGDPSQYATTSASQHL